MLRAVNSQALYLISADHAEKNLGMFSSISSVGNALWSIIAGIAIIAVQKMLKEEIIIWG
ncbi:hypothetical protein BG74_07770 [Sodalis-like endosymbiont of Proechinophthirus fluctus]|uniref:hypothetical protein n=1 Tax=Sodalis-like endosymbiont of Proechinophthirus fluctus TaxID=1462730 RepID=UPI0007A8B747|nr:hypothetical protein [Sodalis-like endosymbiont of Proechinophthirus fluctus]KYP96274.1 hypothetical protein BG74_07770 [Sodalis-like endosymbiont of Proechinophthirus fluctus]